jgi:hypothetical protein
VRPLAHHQAHHEQDDDAMLNHFSIHAFTADWFMHQVVSAIIHSAIYGMAYHLFKGLSLSVAIFTGLACLVVAWLLLKLFRK